LARVSAFPLPSIFLKMKTFFKSLIASAAAMSCCHAQWVYETLYQYQRPGAVSSAPLVVHTDGHTYGTASAGGTLGGGTIFRLAGSSVTTVASLGGTDFGGAPLAGLVSGVDGNLYGTCSTGGIGNFGTIFKTTSAGVVTKLKDFTGTSGVTAGSVPGELVRHPVDGNFYGTTRAGGSGGHGVIFRLTPAGVYTVMAQFTGTSGGTVGSYPVGRLAISGTNLYGMTRFGGAGNFGTAFRISTASGFAFTPLFAFTGGSGSHPGEKPAGGLVLHSDGNFYGTAERGGSTGFGTAFSLTTTTANSFTLKHNFADVTTSQPVGQLVEGADGKLYGAAANGGSAGFGGVFRISTSGTHELLATFTGANGAAPQAGPLRLTSGAMLGVTSAGGPGQLGVVYRIETTGTVATAAPLSPAQGWHPSGAPAAMPTGEWVFPVAFGGSSGGGTLTTWNESAPGAPVPLAIPEAIGQQSDGGLVAYGGAWWGVTSTGSSFNRGSTYSFTPTGGITLRNAHTTAIGSRAEGPLTVGADGLLYGLAREGGADTRGTLFQINATGARTAIFSFTGISNSFPGRTPRGPLVLASNGALFGVTEIGGTNNLGVIFKFTPPATYQVITEFQSSGPNTPRGGLVSAPNGLLYGTTSKGGTNDTGTVFVVDPSNNSLSVLASFPTTNGEPEGELVRATDGAILGFTTTGNTNGAVFRFRPLNNTISFPAVFTGSTGGLPGAALSANSSGIKFTGGLRELSPGRWLGVAAGGGSGNGGVIFRLTDSAASPRNAWAASKLTGLDGSSDGDPDRDGIPNVIEYALGSEPAISSPAALPLPSVTGGYLQIVVPRIPARNDVKYYVESSNNLTDGWTVIATSTAGSPFTGPGYVSGETVGTSTKAVSIRLPSPVSSNPRGFLRLRAEH
jgi:uncharacterized repeat protein (TIGR03803 family)